MQIVLDSRTATPHFPGIGRYVTNLGRALPPLLAPHEQLTLLTDGPGPFSLRQQWEVPRRLRRMGATLYHSPYYLMPYRPNRPTILTLYDCIPLRFPQHVSPQARLLFRLATRLALHAADQLIAISAATARDFEQFFGPLNRPITVIPLAADPVFTPRPAAAIAALRQRLGLPPTWVLCVGSGKPHKNLPILLEAWQQRQPTPLPLVIAGTRGHHPAAANVVWLGPVAERDLPALYSGATCFVFPSQSEGFGLPPLEAMACGTPVITTNAASLPEVVGEAALTVPAGNVDALATALQQMLDDALLRQRLSAAGLVQAGRFSWGKSAEMTLHTYRETVHGAQMAAILNLDENRL